MNKEAYLAYLEKRKHGPKVNYYQKAIDEIQALEEAQQKPKLLLHVCCAVCAGWPLEFLKDHFSLTLYYNNSNIYPKEVYERRKKELICFVLEVYGVSVSMVFPAYDNVSYTKELEPMKDDPEGWERCFYCYEKRMEEAYRYATEHDYDYMTTVMSISRQKDSQKLNEIGEKLSKKYPKVKYFYSDFKKKGGQIRRDEIVKEYDLYHQDYCGCIYSYQERQKKIGNQ